MLMVLTYRKPLLLIINSIIRKIITTSWKLRLNSEQDGIKVNWTIMCSSVTFKGQYLIILIIAFSSFWKQTVRQWNIRKSIGKRIERNFLSIYIYSSECIVCILANTYTHILVHKNTCIFTHIHVYIFTHIHFLIYAIAVYLCVCIYFMRFSDQNSFRLRQWVVINK